MTLSGVWLSSPSKTPHPHGFQKILHLPPPTISSARQSKWQKQYYYYTIFHCDILPLYRMFLRDLCCQLTCEKCSFIVWIGVAVSFARDRLLFQIVIRHRSINHLMPLSTFSAQNRKFGLLPWDPCSLKHITMWGSVSNRPTTHLESRPTGANPKGISLEKHLISIKKQPIPIYFLWCSIDP